MTKSPSADINAFITTVLLGDITFTPSEATIEHSDFHRLQQLIVQSQELGKLPDELKQMLLRIDPASILQPLEEVVASRFEDYKSRLYQDNFENPIEFDDFPDDEPLSEEAIFASLIAHNHWQDLSCAAASADLTKLKAAFQVDAADFSKWFLMMLHSAIEAGQEESLVCLFGLARTDKEGIIFNIPQCLHFASERAAVRCNETILKWLWIEEGADLTQFDSAFWRLYFPDGPRDTILCNHLIDGVPGYGNTLLLRAATQGDWALARTLADRINIQERNEQELDTSRALLFLDQIGHAEVKPREPESIKRIITVWLHLASDKVNKVIAAKLGVSTTQISYDKKTLKSVYKNVYKSSHFGPFEARRVWQALREHSVFNEHLELWTELN